MRTIILANIPLSSTEESIRAVCSPFGTVLRVRLFAAGHDSLPDDIATYCMDEQGELKNGYRFLVNHQYAFVEFTVAKQANAAVRALQNDLDWRRGFEATVLHKKSKAATDPSPSPASSLSQSQSRDGAPFIPSAVGWDRVRSSSMSARPRYSPLSEGTGAENRERAHSTNARAGASSASPYAAAMKLRARNATAASPHSIGGAVSSSSSSSTPYSLSLSGNNVNANSSGSWRANMQVAVPGSPSTQRSRSPSLSPHAGRRTVVDSGTPSTRASSVNRSTLSHSESPLWLGSAAGGSSTSGCGERASPVRMQSTVRQPLGPDGSKGFAPRAKK